MRQNDRIKTEGGKLGLTKEIIGGITVNQEGGKENLWGRSYEENVGEGGGETKGW